MVAKRPNYPDKSNEIEAISGLLHRIDGHKQYCDDQCRRMSKSHREANHKLIGLKKARLLLLRQEKRYGLKIQEVVDKKSTQLICIDVSKGKCHNFPVVKELGVRFQKIQKCYKDTGYQGQGLQKWQANSHMPKKKPKKNFLTLIEISGNNLEFV